MLDPAILDSLQTPVPPTPPAIIEQRDWLSPSAERAKRLALRMVEEHEHNMARWVEHIRRTRREIEAAAAQADPALFAAEVGRHIEDVEYQAELRAISAARFVKRSARLTKIWFSRDPALGAISRSLADRLIAAERMAVDELLEQALYLRAFRSERDPDARGGPVFDDPGEMERYLRGAVAA